LAPPPARSEKIAPQHLERLAIVYVRQSTPGQLVRHQESTQIQYSLKLRAAQLGWPQERVQVVDDDQGKSAQSAEARLGFQHLVSEVTLGHVGIVLGVETSRLARSCDDWYPLLKVCSLFGTLIGDLDGIYDPAQYNDRLLLGLKGTMSEAELHILKQRMLQGKLNKARRGDLVIRVPMGYVRRPSGEVAFDPDEQVQEVVRLVFRKFEDLGTLNAVLQYLARNGVKLPVRCQERTARGDLEWHRPNRMTLRNIVKNPIFAGAYAYGRRLVDPRRKVAGQPAAGRKEVGPKQYHALLKDRFPAYISWEQFERNQDRLRANQAVGDAIGAPKHGPSLLSGMVVCAMCGHRMSLRYGGTEARHSYYCDRLRQIYAEGSCQSLAGPCLDRFVSQQVLKALEPASLDLSLEAARNIEKERQEADTLWKKRLERARYEVERTARQYQRVEPENRLVARQLEHEWEEKLRQQRELDEEYERSIRTQPRMLTEEEREAIRKLAADIPALWDSPHTTSIDRKEILRQVVDRVSVEVMGQSERVRVVIHWAGGTQTDHEMTRPVASWEQLSYWPGLVDRIRELVSQRLSVDEIAKHLNADGWKPPKRYERFGKEGVQQLMQRLGLVLRRSRSQTQEVLAENEWKLLPLARELGMPHVTLYLWMRRGWIKGRRSPQGRWIVWADQGELKRLRHLRSLPRGHQTRRHWSGDAGPASTN
jgi:DNA invertase Pin-like site-specific DNA recombinase